MAHFDAAHPAAYYGSADHLSLGAGLIYSGVPYAQYNSVQKQFEIVDGHVLVLTHECDAANEREFNEYVLVCPITRMDAFHDVFTQVHGFDHAANILHKIAKNEVYRVFFLPPGPSGFEWGGLLYLN